MSAELLEILRCPLTGQRVEFASAEELARIEALRATGALHFRNGAHVMAKIESALITADRALLYRAESGIPILLPDEAITLP